MFVLAPAVKSSHARASWALLASMILAGLALFSPCASVARGQSTSGEDEEVVANLAAGRAVILVGKDGIAVGTLEARAEADTRPPLIVPLGSFRVAVLLGAAEWVTPDMSRPPLRLDAELRRVAGLLPGHRKDQATATSDIEQFGIAFLEPLRAVAARLHRQLNWPKDEVLVELLLVQYVEAYGPEVWSIRYTLEQEPMRGEFYNTRVPRPRYVQLYPPEKGQPHTLMESSYPRSGTPLPLLVDLLKSNDPRMARLRSADAQLAHAAEQLDRGEGQKLPANEGLQFLRAALNSLAESKARQMAVLIRQREGLEWVAGENEVAISAPVDDKTREPGAPTLRKKP